MKKNTNPLVVLAACAVAGGCGNHYVTPAGGVPLAAHTESARQDS